MNQTTTTLAGKTCAICGGPVTKGMFRSTPRDEYPLVHVNREDWQDNPHNVVVRGQAEASRG